MQSLTILIFGTAMLLMFTLVTEYKNGGNINLKNKFHGAKIPGQNIGSSTDCHKVLELLGSKKSVIHGFPYMPTDIAGETELQPGKAGHRLTVHLDETCTFY